jgi:hypothetical protein
MGDYKIPESEGRVPIRKKYLFNNMGKGIISFNPNTGVIYKGNCPMINDGDEVMMIPVSEFEEFVKKIEHEEIQALLKNKSTMPKQFHDGALIEDEHGNEVQVPPMFGNHFIFTIGKISDPNYRERVTLYLDRHLYTTNPLHEMWIRYVSVEKSMEEEDPDEESPKPKQLPETD